MVHPADVSVLHLAHDVRDGSLDMPATLPTLTLSTRWVNVSRLGCRQVDIAVCHRHLNALVKATVLVVDARLLPSIALDGVLAIRRTMSPRYCMLAWPGAVAPWLGWAVRLHAHGAVPVAGPPQTWASAVDAVLDGQLAYDSDAMSRLWALACQRAADGPQQASPFNHDDAEARHAPPGSAGGGLSQREAEVLLCMRQGMSNPQIALRLCISINTVKKHLAHVYAKLGLHSGRQMVH